MQKAEAEQFVSAVWCGRRQADEAFYQALAKLGIPRAQYHTLTREVRRCERGRTPGVILTPTGGKAGRR